MQLQAGPYLRGESASPERGRNASGTLGTQRVAGKRDGAQRGSRLLGDPVSHALLVVVRERVQQVGRDGCYEAVRKRVECVPQARHLVSDEQQHQLFVRRWKD